MKGAENFKNVKRGQIYMEDPVMEIEIQILAITTVICNFDSSLVLHNTVALPSLHHPQTKHNFALRMKIGLN